jgi:predicted glutamine amidotransferase
MCRLLGFVAPAELSLEAAAGPATLHAFRGLASIHGDGWGMAWTGTDGVDVRRSTSSAAEDPTFADCAREVAARAGFLHLRWATTGIPVQPANTHPFVADGWAFAHNGFVRGADAIERLLSPMHHSALVGTTDSERYFRLVLQCAEQTGDMLAGLQLAAHRIMELSGAVSLNAMLLSADRLLAVHGLHGSPPPVADLLELVARPEDLPIDHLDSYFQLSYRVTDDALVVASSGVPREGWTLQPPNMVMDIDVASGQWRNVPLLAVPAAPVARWSSSA